MHDHGTGRLLVARLSFGHWNSPIIEAVAVLFMMMSGVSFALYFFAWKQRSLRVLWNNVEVRAFYLVVLGTIALIATYLTVYGVYPDFEPTVSETLASFTLMARHMPR